VNHTTEDRSESKDVGGCRCGQDLVVGLARLLNLAQELRSPKLYGLDEVAGMTGVALRALQDGARNRQFEHVLIGKTRAMTAEQVDKLVAQHTISAQLDDDLVIEFEPRRRSGRYGRRRGAL
jgi:hypothetical protein